MAEITVYQLIELAMVRALESETSMADRIMDCAQLLVQTNGYNGFSYADIAGELGIRNATIHYYFRAKADLCTALLRRYRDRFRLKVTQGTDPMPSPREKLTLYMSYYAEALSDGRLCPCGVLSTELLSLDATSRQEIRGFFSEQIAWVQSQIIAARDSGHLRTVQPMRQVAAGIFSAIQGGMLLARALEDPQVLTDAMAASLAFVFG